MKKTVFIKNAAVLTVSSLVLRFAGVFFKVWLAAKIGSEGIGLYQIIFSVYMFAATFATSGISTAVTRLVSEEIAVGQKKGISRIMIRCFELSLITAVFSITVLYFGADFISKTILKEPRAALSLKILGFSLPFMAISSCIRGYFIARRRAVPSSLSQIIEQTARISIIFVLLTRYGGLGLEYMCAAVLAGDTLAEAISCGYIYAVYKFDFCRLKIKNEYSKTRKKIVGSVTHIAAPITAGRYLNSFLRMIENVLVPQQLGAENGMSLFGMIKGMALPLLFFPSALLGAMSTLLIPEISESAIKKRPAIVQNISYRIIKITSIAGMFFSAVFFTCGKELGTLIFRDAEVGRLLCLLSPIVPFMYLDAVSDGILKGLDQQKFTFKTSVGDSLIRIALILLLLKNYGIDSFIWIMYFSNFLTCFLNTLRLVKVTGLKPDFADMFVLPLCGAFSICLFLKFVLKTVLSAEGLLYTACMCVLSGTFYVAYLFLLNSLHKKV